jgi:hypothetical protein
VNIKSVSAESICDKLLRELGGTYPSYFGINLSSMLSEEVFKWFLASILLGERIDGDIAARNTYSEFERAGVLSIKAVIETGQAGLVDILNQRGYVKHNREIAIRLHKAARVLDEKYSDDLNRLHFFARGGRDLEEKLQNLGKNINTTTINIFLRGLRGVWEKVELPLSESALPAARNLGLIHSVDAPAALEELKAIWNQDETRLSDLEAALIKLNDKYCCKNRCLVCPMKEWCKNYGK